MGCVRAPVTLLSGVTGTGPGSTRDLGEPHSSFSYVAWATLVGGNISGASIVHLEGSQDGSHWFDLAAPQITDGGLTQGRADDTVHFQYIRANVTGIIPGDALTMTVVVA